MAWLTLGKSIDDLMGMYDETIKTARPEDFQQLFEKARHHREGDPFVRAFPVKHETYPDSAITHARVRTAFVPLFRVHNKERLFTGDRYPENWLPDERRRQAAHRYAPRGLLGFYFGLTVDAALDEASYYSNGHIDSQKEMILALWTYLDNLLYLAPVGVLSAVWGAVGLKPVPLMQMYLDIMNPETGNDITNRIGIWARAKGFSGLIYPSARYDEAEQIREARGKGKPLAPVLNLTRLGTHLCDGGVIDAQIFVALLTYIKESGRPPTDFVLASAEANLVLFDEQQLLGRDRPVFFKTWSIEREGHARGSDKRPQTHQYTQFAFGKNGPEVFQTAPDFTLHAYVGDDGVAYITHSSHGTG